MSTGHGGARSGAGRKRKALAEKLDPSSTTSKYKIKTLKKIEQGTIPDLVAEDMPEVSEYLKRHTKNIGQKLAPEIFANTWRWLKERDCEGFVVKELIELYALALARAIQCEEAVDNFGFLAKHPTTGNPQVSPYAGLAMNYAKQANGFWGQIFQIVKENASVKIDKLNPNDQLMTDLLNN